MISQLLTGKYKSKLYIPVPLIGGFTKRTKHVSVTERSNSFVKWKVRKDIFSFKIWGLNDFKGRMMYAHFCFTSVYTEKLSYLIIRVFRPAIKCHFVQKHVQSREDFWSGVIKGIATIKTSRIVRRSTNPKYLITSTLCWKCHKWNVLDWYFHGQINFGSKSDKDK